MKPRPKLRRIVKWGATSLTAVVLVIWILSGWGAPMYCTGPALFGWLGGQFLIEWTTNGDPMLGMAPGWNGGFFTYSFEFQWRLYTSYPFVISGQAVNIFAVPGWALAILLAIPTAFFWRSDWFSHRRRLLGHCKECDYDRRGLDPAASCPECGTTSS